MDAFDMHMENRTACCEYDEPEPERDETNPLQTLLRAAWYSYIYASAVGEIQEPRQ